MLHMKHIIWDWNGTLLDDLDAVSYTHLDVYKRQQLVFRLFLVSI